MKEKIVHH